MRTKKKIIKYQRKYSEQIFKCRPNIQTSNWICYPQKVRNGSAFNCSDLPL